MKYYGDYLPFLREELKVLEGEGFRLAPGAFLDAMSREGSELGDQAVREYAKSLVWPILDDATRFEVSLRLRFTIWMVESMSRAPAENDKMLSFLEWSMISCWKDWGREDWISSYILGDEIVG